MLSFRLRLKVKRYCQQLTQFKYLAALILLLSYSSYIFAGTSYHPWYRDWQPDISPDSCGLSVSYADKTALFNPRVSVDKYVTFDSFYLRFSIPIMQQEIAGKTFTKGALYLFLISSSLEKLSKTQHRIIGVSSRGHKFKTYAIDHSPNTNFFYLEATAARSIFSALKRAEKTELILTLEDKSSRTLTIRNQHSDRFSIWTDMLKACYISRISSPVQSD